MLLMGYDQSPFQKFHRFFRMVVGLDEEDVQLILKQFNSKIVTSEVSPGIYSMKEHSEVVYTMCDHEGTLEIKHDDFSMEAELTLTRLGWIFGTLRLDEKCSVNT